MIKILLSIFIGCCAAQSPYESIFTSIYENAVWGIYNGHGYSGAGALYANTKEYREFLQIFLKEKKIKTVVDLGCGDWEFSRFIDWTNISYVGYDIVQAIIDINNQHYATETITFVAGNFLEIDLPSADLLLCKHVLQHLSNEDIIKLSFQFKKYKYCLITNEVNPWTLSSNNHTIAAGQFRPLDLTKRPFNIKGKKILTYTLPRLGTHQVLLIEH